MFILNYSPLIGSHRTGSAQGGCSSKLHQERDNLNGRPIDVKLRPIMLTKQVLSLYRNRAGRIIEAIGGIGRGIAFPTVFDEFFRQGAAIFAH